MSDHFLQVYHLCV